ncbi:sporulation integral membrane protein YlbJ [Lutispora thermophila]|uniref:Sporulation integral membrane protein YlbJ n=1 Tax=Lutispora thermophila DSM 19022 TaxID=1122184 RepID=A0A1M6G451_9FIRM|nr:sporulation integral membrane protein YlbJ [Lutispora thermophila]SHJ04713.1 sporulation integral membrane protein YlbJ [Lutispora thermophila DSM 19022]
MRKNFSVYINALIFIFIITSIITYPQETFKSSLEGLNLWFNVVCPALLPFFICTEILIGLGVVSFIGSIFRPLMSIIFNIPGEGAFAFAMSIASGYPVGAKIVASLRSNNQCTKVEAQRMISLCSTSGPLFIIGAVSVGMLKKPEIASLLLLSHYLSAISCGFIMKFYKKGEKSRSSTSITNPFREMIRHREKDNRNIGQLMGDSVKNGVSLVLLVGGYIVIFSVISRIIKLTGLSATIANIINLLPFINIRNSENISMIITGILEVTNGINACASLYLPDIVKASIVSFFIGFGGISINAQVSGVIQNTDINFFIYFLMKILQGTFAALYTVLLSKIANLPAFSTYPIYPSYPSLSWYSTIILSFKFLSTYLFTLFLLSLIIYIFLSLKPQKK